MQKTSCNYILWFRRYVHFSEKVHFFEKLIRHHLNEVSAKPLHPSNFWPEWQQNIEVGPGQKSSPDNLMIKNTQKTDSGKRKRRDIAQKDQANRLTKSEQQKFVGHKMRFLVGKNNGKINATLTTSKKEIDYQFQYPGKKKVIKEYKNIKDFYSWSDEGDNEMVDTEPIKVIFLQKYMTTHSVEKIQRNRQYCS